MAAPMEKKLSAAAKQRLARRKKWWDEHNKNTSETKKKSNSDDQHEPKRRKVEKLKKEANDNENPWKKALAQRQTENDNCGSEKEVVNTECVTRTPGGQDERAVERSEAESGALCVRKTTTGKKTKSKKEQKKYVLFIGNLPYSVTKVDLEDHFIRTGGVENVRLPTDKNSGKPRGFAYIEFKDKQSHTHALRLHHTELKGRKINVEFTSIGGKSKNRLDKLKQKNKSMERFKQFPGSPDEKEKN